MDEDQEFPDKLKAGAKSAFGALREPEGLATAALGAFLINPVIGLALGVGQGLLARRDRRSALEEAAADREFLRDLNTMHTDAVGAVQGLGADEFDQAQLDQLTRDMQPLMKLAMHPDPTVRRDAMFKLAEMSPRVGDWLEDLETRNEGKQDAGIALLDEQAVVARQNRERGLDRAQSATRVGSEIHQLLSDPDFDVNNPASRARLGQLMDQTPREFLADAPDMADTWDKVGASLPGIPQAIASYFTGKMKAEEFNFSKEDWRKVANAMVHQSKRQADRIMQDAERIGVTLDRAALGIKHKPALSYLDRIMTGEVQEGESISDRPGYYDEIARTEAEKRAAAADESEKLDASKKSTAVARVKEKAKDVLLNVVDPWGMFRNMAGDAEGAANAPFAPKRRPTN